MTALIGFGLMASDEELRREFIRRAFADGDKPLLFRRPRQRSEHEKLSDGAVDSDLLLDF